jgi:alpha-glucuronidase
MPWNLLARVARVWKGFGRSCVTLPPDEDGYELWLRYRLVSDPIALGAYRERLRSIVPTADSPILRAAVAELRRGLFGLLGRDVPVEADAEAAGALVIAPRGSSALAAFEARAEPRELGREGFELRTLNAPVKRTGIVGASDTGALYGAFHLLRLLQTGQNIEPLSVTSRPRVGLRLLDHWDNLDRTVERGYAGFSLWDWHELPHHLDPRYTDNARACASIGINGSVLTNVNANALVLSDPWLDKVAALAGVFRPYGMRVYLTARFSAPIDLDGLPTADPRDKDVQAWWRRRVDRIYKVIPDFGGFLVKANSQGQPGPRDYGRSHAEGANLIADALAEHGGRGRNSIRARPHRDVRRRQHRQRPELVRAPLCGCQLVRLWQVRLGPLTVRPSNRRRVAPAHVHERRSLRRPGAGADGGRA